LTNGRIDDLGNVEIGSRAARRVGHEPSAQEAASKAILTSFGSSGSGDVGKKRVDVPENISVVLLRVLSLEVMVMGGRRTADQPFEDLEDGCRHSKISYNEQLSQHKVRCSS
jgi:hypothetical protein